MANNLFYGDLNGEQYYDVVHDVMSLDRTEKSYSKRLESVQEVLNKHNYFVDYLSDYYDPYLKQSDKTSEENNVFGLIETMIEYLLNSQEVKEMDKAEQTKYVNSTTLDRKLYRERSESNVLKNSQILKFDKSNQIKGFKQKITKKDLDGDSYTAEVLRDYQTYLDNAQEQRNRGYGNPKLNSIISGIRQDMLIVKDQLNGVWGYNIQDHGSTTEVEPELDFTDKSTILNMMRADKADPTLNNNLWIAQQDFENYLNSIDYTDKEKTIIQMIKAGFTEDQIGDCYNITHQSVSKAIDIIVKKFQKLKIKY